MDNIDVVSQYASPPHPPASLEVLLLVQSYLHSNNLEMPCSITDALMGTCKRDVWALFHALCPLSGVWGHAPP